MALKRTKLEKWQRNAERLEKTENTAVKPDMTDERSETVAEMAQQKTKAAAA